MTRISVDKDELRKFILSFGWNVNDLILDAKEFSLVGGVAMPTHFFTQRISATVDEPGQFIISDIGKVAAFLRACDGNSITMWQKSKRPLHLSNGGTEVTLPTVDSVRSALALPTVTKLVSESTDADWKSWAGEALNCYGLLDKTSSLVPVSQMQRVVGKDKVYVAQFHEEQLTITGGDKTDAQMSVVLDLHNADGPAVEVSNTFGPWLPQLLSALPAGACEIYTGDGSILAFNHTERECLLVVIPQGE